MYSNFAMKFYQKHSLSLSDIFWINLVMTGWWLTPCCFKSNNTNVCWHICHSPWWWTVIIPSFDSYVRAGIQYRQIAVICVTSFNLKFNNLVAIIIIIMIDHHHLHPDWECQNIWTCSKLRSVVDARLQRNLTCIIVIIIIIIITIMIMIMIVIIIIIISVISIILFTSIDCGEI